MQDEPIALDKQHSRDSTAITHSSYSLPASSYSQDPVYINGSLNYSYRGYGSLGGSLQPPASLQTGNHSNGKWLCHKWLCQGHGEPTLASPLPQAQAVHQGLLASPTVGLISLLEEKAGRGCSAAPTEPSHGSTSPTAAQSCSKIPSCPFCLAALLTSSAGD